jgi:hypothetical protein
MDFVEGEHTWDVTVVCPEGESTPVSITDSCIGVCNPVTNPLVVFTGTASAKITWTAVEEAMGYKVSRAGNLSTVTEPEYTETDDFIAGTEYLWTIVTVCQTKESEPVEVKGTPFSGIKDGEFASFSIGPNPAHQEITITANVLFHTIEVINFLGQTVVSQSNDKETATLDVVHLTNGIYFIRIVSENGTSVKKFVKQ